jgi:hypothetical protein
MEDATGVIVAAVNHVHRVSARVCLSDDE